MNFMLGVIFGIILATIGAHGVADYVDRGVDFIKKEATHMKQNR